MLLCFCSVRDYSQVNFLQFILCLHLNCLVLFVSHTDYIPVGIALANDLFALTNKLQYVAQDPLIHVNSSCCFCLKGTENKNGYFVASQDRTLRSHLQKIPGNILFHLILIHYSEFVSP